MLTDSHCHLDGPKLLPQLDAVLDRALQAGVTRVMTVSSEAGDFERVVATCGRLASELEGAWCAVGVHPHEASKLGDAMLVRIRDACSSEHVVAVGEIGLDFHYDHSPRDVQERAFREQLGLARELGLPVVVHSREAEDETIRVLREGARGMKGVLHCFTSERRLADAAVELGFLVSFSGILTFPSAADLRATAAALPSESLLVETDSPYLAPIPHRGRTCEPAFVRDTARLLAGVRGVSLEEIAATTSANFDRVFLRG